LVRIRKEKGHKRKGGAGEEEGKRQSAELSNSLQEIGAASRNHRNGKGSPALHYILNKKEQELQGGKT